VTTTGLPRIFSVPEPDPNQTPEPELTLSMVPEPPGTIPPGTTELVPEPADGSGLMVPGTTAELVPVFTVPVRRVRLAERLLLAARRRIALIADTQRRHRTFWHAIGVFITRLPETRTETETHLESREWLQEWMTGKLRVFCEWENIAWGHLVSIPGRAVLQLVEKVFLERQSRFWIAMAVIGAGLLLRFASHL
jgi:hypothetical protein